MIRAGWYDDPLGAQDLRWWDGSQWTGHVRDDPTGTPPPQPVAPPPPAARPSGGGGRRLLPIVSLLVVGWLVVVGFGAEDRPASPPPPAAPSEQAPAGPASVDADLGAVQAGSTTPFTVDREGVWVAEFEVPAGRLVVDVRGISGFDPIATLLDVDGRELAFNDDRSTEQLETFGGGVLDSLIDVRLDAGRYRVQVEEWGGDRKSVV